jgi:carbon-monoxide dehydrogenase small subunit
LKHTIRFRLNGEDATLEVQTHETLLEVLRKNLHLHGTRETCGIGSCEVQTIEGLAENGKLHPIQEAFLENNAFQCSYCTPGMILATKALLDETPSPSVEQIKEYLAGNLCRCGSYMKIITAVQEAAKLLGK